MSRRPLAAALALALLFAAGCGIEEKARSFGDKAAVCAEALKLVTLFPDANNPEKTKQEAQEKADRLRGLANDTVEGDVKGALNHLADEYTSVAKKGTEEVRNFAGWVDQLAANQAKVGQVCL